ncbi:MAG: glycosyltransferase, partial [bacterium]
MNILHVLSQSEVTGAEVYAATLADRQVALGDSVFLVSDTLAVPVAASYTSLPIGRRSYPNRWRNVRSLSSLITRHRIDVVHAHSRAASWVSFFACKGSPAVLVSTVHGRQHLHLSIRLFNVYSNHVIAISESIKEQLVNKMG